MGAQGDRRTAVGRVGSLPPLLADGSTAEPERRDLSVRYLTGTLLTGAVAFVLMSGALWNVAEGEERAVVAATVPLDVSKASETVRSVKAGRLERRDVSPAFADHRLMSVPMLVATDQGEVVRSRPFARVGLPLGVGHVSDRGTPRFDPLAIFRARADEDSGSSVASAIYGAQVDTAVRLTRSPIDADASADAIGSTLVPIMLAQAADHTAELLLNGRDTGTPVVNGTADRTIRDAGTMVSDAADTAPANVSVMSENVTLAHAQEAGGPGLVERSVAVRGEIAKSIGELAPEEAERFANALKALDGMGERDEASDASLQLAFADDGSGTRRLVRASLYDGATFRAAVALTDEGSLAPASPGKAPSPVAAAVERPVNRSARPRSLHDALYQTAFSAGVPDAAIARIGELIASSVDFRGKVGADDRIDTLFALPEGADALDETAQLVFLEATIGGQVIRLYRHADSEGRVGWFDAEGRGSRPFLIRKPIVGGRFRSSFGMRRHPIRKRMKMHWGVDWAAPKGTPILAAADGVVEEARSAGGHGRRIILRHANGYRTAYSHQSRFAKGMKPGRRVRQGEVIGYVGTTGLSTGNHLHYELSINGEKVDPLRVRLPAARSIQQAEMARFTEARQRIDELLAQRPREVASR